MRQNPIPESLGLRTLAEGLDHPEGVCWSEFDGMVYAGGESGQLYRFPPEGGVAEVVTTVDGGFLLGMAFDGGGSLYACDSNHHRVWRIRPDGSHEPYGEGIGYPNYPVFDAEGGLWVSDSGSVNEATGRLIRILPGGRMEEVPTRPIMYANGLAVRDGWLYVVESGLPGVSRMPLGGGQLERVVELPFTTPDGLAFDAEGGLWIGCYQPNRIYRLDPAGELETVVDDWTGEYVLSPTNLAFAGSSLDVLLLASLCGWWVKAIDPGVRGARLEYPDITG
jgi:sugar lactone lactonase YvrE